MPAEPFKAVALTSEETVVHSENLISPLSAAGTAARTLPYFHSCTGKSFRSILSSGTIKATDCPVFSEKLLYFFYGKPAYRLSGADTNTRDTSRFPICFVISDLEESSIKRIFPFDTGALAHGIFKDVCGDTLNPFCFEIGSTKDDISSIIKLLYETDNNYFFAKPTASLDDLDALWFELRQVLSFILHYADSDWDSRAHSIEVQQNSDLSISGAQIEAVILPDSFLNNASVADFLYNNGIEPIEYCVQHSNPKNATDILFENARRYLVDKGLL